MKKLYFDIETLPAREEATDTLRYLYDRKMSKRDPDSDREPMPFTEFFEKTGLDGAYGQVLVIAYAIDDEPVEYLCDPDNEVAVLEKFWKIASGVDIFVGHNIRDFDLPFIMQRSIVLGVKPSWSIYQEAGKKPWEMNKYLNFARYNSVPIFDTMWEWSRWVDKWSNKNLEHIALALGIPTPKQGIDGTQVAEFYRQGKVKEICDYCVRDVETTRAVYKRMVFETFPDSEPF